MKNTSGKLWVFGNILEKIDWDLVFESVLPRVYNFFLYKIGDRESAQDLTATTFERAWRLRSRYKMQIASLPTWLFGIARNVLKEHLRKDKLSVKRTEPIPSGDITPSPEDIESSTQQKLDKEHLRKLLFELTERERDLIAMKYGAGLTNREIARITKISESNVGSILHRTVKNLRDRLEDEYG